MHSHEIDAMTRYIYVNVFFSIKCGLLSKYNGRVIIEIDICYIFASFIGNVE